MKKKMVLSVVCLIALSAFGQSNDQDLLRNVNWKEDSTEITTINDIIQMQQDVTNKNYTETHFRKVWSRKTYWNVSYNTTTLTPDQVIKTGVGDGIVPEFKSDWGVSTQLGHSYALHKTPIANMVQFNLDYTYIDLGANHFKKEGNGKNLYDSEKILPTSPTGSKCYYTPWNLEKYELNYGMALGPSISIAPFNTTNLRGLHYMKLNAYYHIGYHCSLLWMQNDESADVNQEGVNNYDEGRHENMAKGTKLDLGHGLTQSFGVSLTWKVIGIGYEYRSTAVEYQPLSSSDFGKDKYKFKSGTDRIFIQFRL